MTDQPEQTEADKAAERRAAQDRWDALMDDVDRVSRLVREHTIEG